MSVHPLFLPGSQELWIGRWSVSGDPAFPGRMERSRWEDGKEMQKQSWHEAGFLGIG